MPRTATATAKVKHLRIPVSLTAEQFESFVLPSLSMPKRRPACEIGYHKLFNYVLKVLYTGMQWKELPIELGQNGKPEIHYTGIYKRFVTWSEGA